MNQTERTNRGDALAHAVHLATAGQLRTADVVDYADTLRAFLAGERTTATYPAAADAVPNNERRQLLPPFGECGDQRALHGEALAPALCTMSAGHDGNHRGGMYNWPQVPAAGRLCGSVRYSQFTADGAPVETDLRSVCTLPVGHLTEYPTHEGPDQQGRVRAWPRDAVCNASQGPMLCSLGAGHTGSHARGGQHWQNALQP